MLLSVLVAPYLLITALILAYGREQNIWKNREYNTSVTVFIPTYNEEKYIETKLENLISQTYSVNEILIYDCSTDKTPYLVEKYQRQYPQIKLIRQGQRIGPARTFNQALMDAKGEIIIKTDADVLLKSHDAINNLICNFSNPGIGAVCAVYVKERGFEKHYRNLMTMIQVAESNIDSTVIAHTGLLAFRKSATSLVDPNSMAEDTEEFILVRKNGFKTIIDESVEAEEEIPDSFVLRRNQRDRRAQGIIKAMISNKDVFFNTRFGKYGFIIFPVELFIIALSPFILLTIGGLLAYVLYLINPLFLGFLIIPIVILANRSKMLFAVLDTQMSGLIAACKVMLNKDQPIWKKVR